VAAFSPGDFKPLGNKSTKATNPEASAEEMQNVNPEESNKVAEVLFMSPGWVYSHLSMGIGA